MLSVSQSFRAPNLIFSASEKNKMRGSYFLLFDYLNFDLIGITDNKIKFTLP